MAPKIQSLIYSTTLDTYIKFHHNLLSNVAYSQTDKQINNAESITSFAKEITMHFWIKYDLDRSTTHPK